MVILVIAKVRISKVKATIPLTRRTLMPKGLQSTRRAISFTNFDDHARSNHLATAALVARVQLSCDQSHSSAWGTSVN